MGTPDSEMIVYEVDNGALVSLAENDPMPERALSTPVSAPIGAVSPPKKNLALIR